MKQQRPTERKPAPHELKIVEESGLFDAAFYDAQARAGLTGRDAVAHYLRIGESVGHSPSPAFDAALYAVTNPDVTDAGESLLMHYLTFGKREGRYATREALRRDTEEVSAQFHDARTAFGSGDIFDANGLDRLEAHLCYGWRNGERVGHVFDDVFYRSIYSDVTESGMSPLVHYVRIGRKEGRFVNRSQLAAVTSSFEMGFDEAFYRSQGAVHSLLSAVEDYAALGWRNGKDPHGDFSTTYYMSKYSDINGMTGNPYAHYLMHGKSEGRTGKPAFGGVLRRGALAIDPAKRTVMVAVHECSRTGAPLLGLDIGREMSATCNVIFMTPRTGPIYSDLLNVSCYVAVIKPDFDLQILLTDLKKNLSLSVLFANSVETVEFMEAALYAGVPTVALLHEFAEYTLPHGKVTRAVMAADVVVAPAKLIRDSISTEVIRSCQTTGLNLRIRQQGKLESLGEADAKDRVLSEDDVRLKIRAPAGSGIKVVLGAGYVQPRKGVDTFIQTAAELRKLHGDDIRFVWVGEGYNPDADIGSVWLSSRIQKLGLEDHVFMIPHQPSLDAFFDVSDLFYLPSLLDPFPNVAIDALAAGRRIVCFEGSTGLAEWIDDGRIEGAVAEFGNVSEAAEAMEKLLARPTLSEKNRELAQAAFQMADYVSDLLEYADEAVELRKTILADIAALKKDGVFDANFYSAGSPPPGEAAKRLVEYVARSAKGLIVWNPRPGFNDGLYRSQNDMFEEARAALSHALVVKGQTLPTTHRCEILDESISSQPELRTAIHIHLHYADLANDFENRISEAFDNADVFVTVTNDMGRKEVEFAFRNYKRGTVVVDIVPNLGRDVGPMIKVLQTHAISDRYDLFGHFHGKKTVLAPGNIGEAWREFLLGTLIGTHGTTTSLLELVQTETELGLIFAEDRLNVSWTKNRPFGEAMAKRMTPQPQIERFPVFPVGTMFWARPKALAPLLSAGLTENDYPSEPLPEDGSVLHAIERLLPAITTAAGYRWCTVRRPEIDRKH